jgi:hypothetical protein
MTVTKLSNQQKQQILGEMLKTAAGRSKIAASMIQPLRQRRDYSAVGRKAFLVEQLPDGALPIYDRDPNVAAFIIGEEGENIVRVTRPERVLFPLFEIASNPVIPLTQIKERRFDLIERSLDLAKAEIQAQEDTRVFQVMEAASNAGINPVISVAAPITPSVLADGFAAIEEKDLRVARMFFNARDYTDVRKFGRDIYDIETQAAVYKTGLNPNIWGAQVIVSRIVPSGTVYICTEPEFLGRMPVRTELTILSADDPKNRTIGFSCFENLGMGIHNSSGIQKLAIAR